VLSADLVASSNWLILSAILVPRFLESIDICKADSVDIFWGVEVVPSLLLSALGGEVFSFEDCRIDRLLAEEDCPFFAVGGELSFAGFESRDAIWILLFLTESVISWFKMEISYTEHVLQLAIQ
jgi:hypothetical protein